MKSSIEDLRKRGFITQDDIDKFKNYQNDKLKLLISSKYPVERSVAVRLLSYRYEDENIDFIKILLKKLSVEKSLYTKIEICKALEKGNVATAKEMVKYLGIIGRNQHKHLPEKVSRKKSYPLPRDIIARSLGRMNYRILPVLFDVLKSNDETKIPEVLDAIGFLLFYNTSHINDEFFKVIIKTINKNLENDLIVWKCVCCLSAFKTQESIIVLEQIQKNSENDIIKCEAMRSLRLLKNKGYQNL